MGHGGLRADLRVVPGTGGLSGRSLERALGLCGGGGVVVGGGDGDGVRTHPGRLHGASRRARGWRVVQLAMRPPGDANDPPPGRSQPGQWHLQFRGGGRGRPDAPGCFPAHGPLRLADVVPGDRSARLLLGRRLVRAHGRPPPPALSGPGGNARAHRRRRAGRTCFGSLRAGSTRVWRGRGGRGPGGADGRLSRSSGHLVGDRPVHGGPASRRADAAAAGIEGSRLGREPGRCGATPQVLDHGAGLDLDQCLLAFPGQLGPDSSRRTAT